MPGRGWSAVHKLALVLLGLVACGTNSGASTGSASGDSDAGSFGQPMDAGIGECPEETKRVFLMGEDSSFYSFDPPTLTFKSLGRLACGAAKGATPTSMAVDRFGSAWVRHSDASLWKVSTKDLTCEATRFVTLGETYQFYKFGMGFSTRIGNKEDLFLSDTLGAGLAKLDLTTMMITFVGPYTGELASHAAELTGTGDGRLFGFFVAAPAQLGEIAKTTGALLSTTPLPGVDAGDAWAFSFYGGDFYFYTHARSDAGASDGGSDVTRYRPSDRSIAVVKQKVGFKIVGAGVSTCAPTEAPR